MAAWIEEPLNTGLRYSYKIKKMLASCTSEYQKVDLVDTVPFGISLIIDGVMQSSEVDEFMYHEALVHPAMLMHHDPKTVFIGGGGEGSTTREVLKYKTLEKCVWVDIDEKVVSFCREHLVANKHIYDDKRLKLVIDDAKKQLEQSDIKFDVIIMDLADPLDAGPCAQLYTKEFYEMAKGKLNEGGILITQSASAGVKRYEMVFSPVYNTLRQVFPKVYPYMQPVWAFMDVWGFNMALTKDTPLPSEEELDKRIAERITGELRHLDGITFWGLFCFDKTIRNRINAETRVSTAANPAVFGEVGTQAAAN